MPKSLKKWWHFELPFKYYMCHVLGGGAPKKKHLSWFKARREAVRLAQETGLPVQILKTIEVVLPSQRAPAPAFLISSYENRGDDWANDPESTPMVEEFSIA